MGRTLYLHDNNNHITIKRDGPSVLIKTTEKAEQRIPARLVSRVVVIGNVRLDAGAITLFADYDAPVVFMSNSSEESAVTLPYNHRLASHYEEQVIFLQSKTAFYKFKNWADTKRMTIQMKTLRRLFKNMQYNFKFDIGEGNYQLLIKKLMPSDKEQWHLVNETINNLIRSLAIELILKADLDPHHGVIHRRHNFGLALDICYMLGGESDMQSLQFFRCNEGKQYLERKDGRYVITASGMRDIIHRFENRSDAVRSTIETIIDELFDLIREVRT